VSERERQRERAQSLRSRGGGGERRPRSAGGAWGGVANRYRSTGEGDRGGRFRNPNPKPSTRNPINRHPYRGLGSFFHFGFNTWY